MKHRPKIRVASAQMALSPAKNLDALINRIAQFTRSAADYGCDFICFPEHVTLQMLSSQGAALEADESIDLLSEVTDNWKDALSFLAAKHAINIVGGSHCARDDDDIVRNTSWFAHRDGALDKQDKIHPTPDERAVWNIVGGNSVSPIETDCGPIGITICYDSEFPELGRKLADDGSLVVFVPYLTDTENGHWRVTHCCQARAVENQSYIVTAGLCGTIDGVTNLDMAYAQSRIMTPADTGFARGGIAVEASCNCEQLIFAELDLDALLAARQSGAVRNLGDRRDDLYGIDWRG